jgi:hypothetical protein
VVAFLVDAGLVQRQPRGKIEEVDWKELLRRWSLDSPPQSRGEMSRLACARGIPDFLARLGSSGFLHALTGKAAFAQLAPPDVPDTAVLYVEDVPAALAQFGLHPTDQNTNVILVKPSDRSVFQRSSEQAGLRSVSPSLMAADLSESDAFESVLAWMATHESAWRRDSESSEVRQSSARAQSR